MANKPVDMSKLKQVLRLYKNGDMSNRKIAETVELDKNTVNKYINQAKKDSLSLDELLALDDPVLAHRMVGGNAAYSNSRFDELKTMLPYFASELKRPNVTMQLLWEEYRKESIRPYGITQFKEHLNRYIAGTTDKTASTILKDLYVGGEKAFLDFAGGKMQYVDVDTGEIHSVEVFVACLPATDYGFAMAVPSQKVEGFIRAVECFLRHIGGVPKILVPEKYYEPKFYTNLTVDDNCCVYLGRDMHYYSVPYKYIGFRMQVVLHENIRGLFV